MNERKPKRFAVGETLAPGWCGLFRRIEVACGFLGAAAAIAHHGIAQLAPGMASLLAGAVVLSLAVPILTVFLRSRWSRARKTFLGENLLEIACGGLWLGGLLLLAVWPGSSETAAGWLGWSEVLAILRGIAEVYVSIRFAADAGLNPALVLVLSFVVLIGIGTLLLMLPRCRPTDEPSAPLLVALFTATSACCVTGLNVVDPATYWSRTGHWVILGLIQIGGLGIMTFGAFFAVALGRNSMREHATFRDLLESDKLGDVGALLRAILGFTFAIELIGAGCLSTLWPERSWDERAFLGLFHSVSAFCNAGFCLRTESLMGWELRWQVWGVVPLLIILGGLGFTPLFNLREAVRTRWFRTPGTVPVRLSLSTRLVTITTLLLLAAGTVCLFALEYGNPAHPQGLDRQWANAWFHSVTLRTAGFNTVDHAQLYPASKLLGIGLMFVGASPGSTGGGVKTICLAVTLLTLRSVLRGRPTVESFGRTIPQEQVFRALAVIAIALVTLMIVTLLIVVIEDRPELFLDQMYEAASALGTVGVSANLTPSLRPASQFILVLTMFLGRVGPLTLIVALAGFAKPGNFRYPDEKIALG